MRPGRSATRGCVASLQALTLGRRRWVTLGEYRRERARLNEYRLAHNGHLPDRGVLGCLKSGRGVDPRYRKYGFPTPKSGSVAGPAPAT